MKVIIVGGGQLGYFLAKNLLVSGHEVKIVDMNKKRCKHIADVLDIAVICGDGTRIETLAHAKVSKYDVLIAVTDKDEDNLIACEIAKKQFNIKKTVSRSNNPKNISIMKKLGVDITLNTTQIITNLIEHEIDGAQVQFIANITNSDAMISEYKIPLTWTHSGIAISELALPENCVLIYLIRSGVLIIPRGNTVIMGGDEVVALTVGAVGKKLKKIFEL